MRERKTAAGGGRTIADQELRLTCLKRLKRLKRIKRLTCLKRLMSHRRHMSHVPR
jgi:hypothetical protein